MLSARCTQSGAETPGTSTTVDGKGQGVQPSSRSADVAQRRDRKL